MVPASPSLFNQISQDEEGPHAQHLWDMRVSTYFGYGTALSWKGLEKWCNAYTTDKTKQRDGRWTIDHIFAAFKNYFSSTTTEQDAWNGDYKKIEAWEQAYPQSQCAPLVEVTYWLAYAWYARGNGYEDSVTPEGQKLYDERLKKAEDVLIANKALAKVNPVWYTLAVRVSFEKDGPSEQIGSILDRSFKQFPGYFQSAMTAAYYLLPKWYGDPQALEKFIRNAEASTSTKQGKSLYARLYWSVAQSEPDLFNKTDVDWSEMKVGFDDLMHMYPDSAWNLNNYASFACRADDKSTYLMLRPKINHDNYNSDAWPSSHRMEICDAHFGLKPL